MVDYLSQLWHQEIAERLQKMFHIVTFITYVGHISAIDDQCGYH